MSLFAKNKNGEGKGNVSITRIMASVAIVLLFVGVGMLVLALRSVLHFSKGYFTVLLLIAVVALILLFARKWVSRLQMGHHKIISWVFIGLLALSGVLWLVLGLLLINNFDKLTTDADQVVSILNFYKFVVVYTSAFITASLITSNILKFGKKMIPFQVILYISNFIVSLYVILFLFCIRFTKKNLIDFSEKGLKFLTNHTVMTIFMLALVFTFIANFIAKRIELRRKTVTSNEDEMPEEVFGGQSKQKPAESTTEEKLTELKSMLDQNLITQEEYEQKKNDLLNKM